MAQGSISPSADFAISGMAGVDFARAHTSTISSPAPHRMGTTVPISGNRVAIYCRGAVVFARASSTVTASVTVVASTDGVTYKITAAGVGYILPYALNAALATGDYVWAIKDGVYV